MDAHFPGDVAHFPLMKAVADDSGMTGAKGGAMHTSHQKKPLLVRLQLRLAQARFVTFSALIHTVLIVMGGSVVLFKQMSDPPDFTAGGESLVAAAPEAPAPVEPQLPTTPADAVAQTPPDLRAPPIEAIVSAGKAPAPFTVNAGTARSSALSASAAESLRGAADKIGRTLGSGKMGATNPFGAPTQTADGFTGTFYDLKQTRSGKPTDVTPAEYQKIFRKFVRENWRESVLTDYFRGPQKLHTPQIFIPNMPADEGPKAFGLADKVKPSRWLVHYKARVSPPTDGTYHFVGGGDDVMIVRFNGKVVLDRCWHQQDEEWKASRNYDYGYTGIPNGFARGDAMRLKAGQFYDMEVLIGEQPGGLVFFSLLLEEEGVEYTRDAKGNPILPVFRLAAGPLPEPQPGQTFPPYDPVGPIWKAAPMKTGGGSAFDGLFPAKQGL